MNEIYDACHSIRMSKEEKERILAKKRRRSPLPVLIPCAGLACLLLFTQKTPETAAVVPRPSEPSVNETAVSTEEPAEEDTIVFNSLAGQSSNADVVYSAAEVTDAMFIDRLCRIRIPEDMEFQNAYGLYGTLTAPQEDRLFGYAAGYSNPDDEKKNILLFFSQTAERMPSCYHHAADDDEPSSVNGTEVVFYKEGQEYGAVFTRDGWHYDIQAFGLMDEEITAFVRSLTEIDLEPVPPVLDAYAGMQAEQTVLLPPAEERSAQELYEEADLVAMIHIITITGSIEQDGEVYTEGSFSAYHSYKWNPYIDSEKHIDRFLRKGGISGTVQTMREGDFLPEQGKCYLAFMKLIDDETAEIIGYQDGFRELEKYVPSFDRTKLSFYNSRTGEYEPIVRILPYLEDYGECFP